MIVNFVVTENTVQPSIYLGRQGERGYRTIQFDLTSFTEKYGEGTPTLYFQPPGGSPAEVATGLPLSWTIAETDTERFGEGMCEIVYEVGDAIIKSPQIPTMVRESLTGGAV